MNRIAQTPESYIYEEYLFNGKDFSQLFICQKIFAIIDFRLGKVFSPDCLRLSKVGP